MSFLKCAGIGFLAGCSFVALESSASFAQSQLPSVTVDAPAQQARRAPSARRASTATQTRRAARRSPQAPVAAVVPASATTLSSATGPVAGFVATRSATGTKTNTPLIETPQSISVVSQDQIRTTGARTVGEALAYTAGVQTQPFGFDPRYDQFLIRGFAANQFGNYRDGLRQGNGSFAYFRNEPYGAERLEVMRGPSSVLYGSNEAGGMVNYVSKMPLEYRLNEVGLDIGNFDRYQGRFDFSGPTLDNPNLLYRFTGLVRDSGTQVPSTKDDRVFLAPSFTAKLGEDTTITVLAEYERSKTAMWPYYLRNPATGTVTNIRISDPAYDALVQSQASIGYKLEHRANEALAFRQNVRIGHVAFDGTMIGANGGITPGNTLNRYAAAFKERLNTFNIDNQMEARLATGPIKHTVLAGVDYFRQSTAFAYYQGLGVPALDLANPVYGNAFPSVAPPLSSSTSQTLGQLGVYLQDQMALGGFRLTIGGRQDFAETSSRNDLNGMVTTSDPSKFTYRAGLLYLFDNGLAPYVNYATSFLPQSGTTAPARGATPFAPTTGESFEAGVKYQPLGWNSYFTATWFNLTKNNVPTTDPVYTSFQIQTGQVRSRGVELEAVLSLAEGLKGVASYSNIDAKVTASNGVDFGKVPVGVPTEQAAMFLDYTWQTGPLAGFGLGAGVRWIDQTWADNINTIRNPAITAFDAGVHYDYRGALFAVNARNLSDQRVGICNFGNCTFSQGRTVLGSVTYRW